MEFLLNMGDWPQNPRVDPDTAAALPPLPLFSWCGATTHWDMVLPTYKIVQAAVFGKVRRKAEGGVGGGRWAAGGGRPWFCE